MFKSIIKLIAVILLITTVFSGCDMKIVPQKKLPVIFDTDANNELDDQHALAYLLFNGDYFDVEGVTVNTTGSYAGANVEYHVRDDFEEAKRVMQLCGELYGKIPLKTGANSSFVDIREQIGSPDFDGYEAVDFIIEKAMEERSQKLILLPVGKLTNIALALLKEPAIADKIRIVWLGSNYPEPGEHNQNLDVESMNYILDLDVPFEMVTVRYGKPSGTTAVVASKAQVLHQMPGKGPKISTPIEGRQGGKFDNFGDYSVDLFEKGHAWGEPPGRSLFDMAAVAIVKNSAWAETREIPAPLYENGSWIERPNNPRKIILWEWFDIYGILNDFFVSMDNYKLVETE